MLTRTKQLGRAVLQTNLHLPLQDEHPLRMAADMELAPEAHWAFAQLQTMGRQQTAQAGLWCALVQKNGLVTKTGAAIGVGE